MGATTRNFRDDTMNPCLERLMVKCMGGDSLEACVEVIQDLWPTVRNALYRMGPLFVLILVCLIGFVIWAGFAIGIPMMTTGLGMDVDLILWTYAAAWGGGISINVFYNLWKCVFLDAGTAPLYAEFAELAEEDGRGGLPAGCKKCEKCSRVKPPRAHHCSYCGKGVLRYDHHCPWINDCVGLHNYRHFCLFLWWISAGCLLVVIVWPLCVPGFLLQPSVYPDGCAGDKDGYLVMTLCICLGGLCASGPMGCMHVYLAVTNQTTVELLTNRRKGLPRIYDFGRADNWKQIFGNSKALWIMPCLAKKPTSDGMSYPLAPEKKPRSKSNAKAKPEAKQKS